MSDQQVTISKTLSRKLEEHSRRLDHSTVDGFFHEFGPSRTGAKKAHSRQSEGGVVGAAKHSMRGTSKA